MKKILIIYTSAGLGHKKIGENIGAVLSAEHQVELIDLFALDSGKMVFWGKRIYYLILKYWPGLWSFFYTNKIFLSLALPLRTVVASFKTKKLREALGKKDYDIVISVHNTASAILSYLKSKHLLKPKFVIAFSDYHLHPFWVFKNADLFLANIVEQKEQLVARGVSPDKIAVCGFTLPAPKIVSKDAIRQKYDLNPRKKVILYLGGTGGHGIDRKEIINLSKLAAEILVICGQNELLKQQLQIFFAGVNNVQIYGYIDFNELYPIADLVITKPGGSTIAECLEHKLPILVSYYLPGQEKLNIEYLQGHRLIMPKFLDLYGAVADELQTHAFSDALKVNPDISLVVQHGEQVRKAITAL